MMDDTYPSIAIRFELFEIKNMETCNGITAKMVTSLNARASNSRADQL
jgi:hypothetical protein